MKKITSYLHNAEGYILLFSIVLTAIMLSMAIGVINMGVRQRIFTQQVTQSTRSFYAADTGLECLIALDNRGDFGSLLTPNVNPVPATCNGNYATLPVSSNTPVSGANGNVFTYDAMAGNGSTFLEVGDPNGTNSCARARVSKHKNLGPSVSNPLLNVYEHKIEVWGYNVNCTALHDHYLSIDSNLISPIAYYLVERNLTYTYQTEE